MIAKLRGTLDSLDAGAAVIDVGGVGYLVACSSRTAGHFPPPGGAVTVLVVTEVREDAIQLFGFAEATERDWFRLLTTVQGVGARVALGILSALSANELTTAILAQDKAMLTRADGVGPKLATRIATELKDKVARMGLESGSGAPAIAAASPAGGVADAVSALVNLGYGRAEASSAVGAAAKALGADAPVETLITHGLKELAS